MPANLDPQVINISELIDKLESKKFDNWMVKIKDWSYRNAGLSNKQI